MQPVLGARELVKRRTRAALRRKFNQYPQIFTYKQYMKYSKRNSSRTLLIFMSTLREKTTDYFAWLNDWIPSWQKNDLEATGGGGGGGQEQEPQENDKHLTVSKLVKLLRSGDIAKYVTHFTSNRGVGTCQSPVIAETRPEYKKNPTSPNGIYGWEGISLGAGGYGGYGVLLLREDGTWLSVDGWELVWVGDWVQATGVYWFYTSDLEKALEIVNGL